MCVVVFEIKRETIFIALKTSRSKQLIMSQNSFNSTENIFNRFFEKLLDNVTINRLKCRFNRLNWL